MKVSLFSTCLIDQVYPEVGVATVRLLQKLGVEVEFDLRQTCCGQPAFNTGYSAEARKVARGFIRTYSEKELIVVPSGSCTTMIKKFIPGLFDQGSAEWQMATAVADRTHELSDFLVNVLQRTDVGARFSARVTYHDSCHLLRELRIKDEPRALIRAVQDVDFLEMSASDRCCGFGGTFSVKFEDISSALGSDKVQSIVDSGAQYVIANDVSCLMHLKGIIDKRSIQVQTMHLAELLVK